MKKFKSPMESQSAKVAMITAIVTAISTIIVAFIGIFPQLRQEDANKIDSLKTKLDSLIVSLPTAFLSGERWDIEGKVTSDSISQKPLNKAEIYLIPADGREYFAMTDDLGKFVFNKVAPGPYWIVVRDLGSDAKSSGRALIDINSDEVPVYGAHIRYSITKN